MSRSALALLLLTVSCVGPTLDVGELEVVEGSDAGELDAGQLDGGDASAGRRDASFADRDDFQDERRFCRDERDCALFNFVRDHCNVTYGQCVQCFNDRHCASGRCSESEGVCKGKDDPGPSPAP